MKLIWVIFLILLISMTQIEPVHRITLQYIKDTKRYRQNINFDFFQNFLIQDLENEEINFNIYLEELASEIPASQMAEYLATLTQYRYPKKIAQKICFYLINHKRPLFIRKGLNLVEELNDAGFIPVIIDLIYSEHTPLQKSAIELVIKLKGNAEKILERHLNSKSARKANIANEVLMKINPQNIKLAIKMLEHHDFISKIAAIRNIGNTGKSKYISKLTPLLKDNDISVRKAAVNALASIGAKNSRKNIKKILYQTMATEDHAPLKNYIKEIIEKMSNNKGITLQN